MDTDVIVDKIGIIDTHCHLDAAEFENDRSAVLVRAQAKGVRHIVVPAVAQKNFLAVSALCRAYPSCYGAYGIHPLYADSAEESDLDILRQLLPDLAPVAIGEIGLDYFVSPRNELRQAHFFIEQLKLARAFDLPVLLHVRRAIDDVIQLLRRYPVRGGIAHAFNGSAQQAAALIDLGFALGFGGAMTFSRARRLRHLATTLPLSAIVLETDAPDMSPAWRHKERNEPAELARIAEELAALRGITVEELAQVTTRNACVVLPHLSQV